MAKERRLGPGDPVTFKIPVSVSEEKIELINEWRNRKILAKKIMEKVEEEAVLKREGKIVLPINRELTPEEMERLAIPEVQEMLGNLCLSLLSKQVPTLPIMNSVQTQKEQNPKAEEAKEEFAQEWEVPEEVDDLIDDLLDDL